MENNKDPFPVFCLTMKVLKSPFKTRPIVSCSGSLYHALGIWINNKLEHISSLQLLYIKSSKQLKDELVDLHILDNTTLFTADAISTFILPLGQMEPFYVCRILVEEKATV